MVGVAQLVEHWIVAPVATGSSPVAHPIYSLSFSDLSKIYLYSFVWFYLNFKNSNFPNLKDKLVVKDSQKFLIN